MQLKGLLPNAEYEVTELLPNNLTQQSGNLRIIETEVSVYQLGYSSIILTGEILMQAGLPGKFVKYTCTFKCIIFWIAVKFYTLDDSVLFTIRQISTKFR